MIKPATSGSITAVYENGVLRPLTLLALPEHQLVSLSISVPDEDALTPWLDHEYMAQVESLQEPEPTLEEVWQALSKIPGNLSDDIRAERDARR